MTYRERYKLFYDAADRVTKAAIPSENGFIYDFQTESPVMWSQARAYDTAAATCALRGVTAVILADDLGVLDV